MPTTKAQLLHDIRQMLQYQGDLGLTGLDIPQVSRTAKPEVATASKAQAMRALQKHVGPDCGRCKLCSHRTSVVFGAGNIEAQLMFIGEAPGRDEDLQGIPFVGEAGKLLDRMIVAMGYARSHVYIANVIKCRPPRNRDPEEDEINTCILFLHEQIRIIQPRLIVTLGRIATQALLQTTTSISKLRGRFVHYQNIPLMPTFHPAYLLRNPADKRLVWQDLQAVMEKLKQ